MKKLTEMSEFERRINSCSRPTKFLKIYVNVLLVVGLVLDALNLVARISDPSLTGLEGTPTLYNFYVVYGVVYVIVRFITYMHLKACQKSGYILNYFFLVLFVLYAVLFVNMTVAMLYLIYGICVMVYFYKRKSLFCPGYSAVPTVPEAPAPETAVAPEPAPPVEPELEPEPQPEPAPEPDPPSKPVQEPDFEPALPANPVQDPGPSADDILAEMGKVEPAPPAPAQPTSIDISNLTDEQKALVAQLVDSMKK